MPKQTWWRLSPLVWAVFVSTSFFFEPVAGAATRVRELDRTTLASIRSARLNARIVLPNVILSETDTISIELEEFSVWAPDADIVVYGSDGPRRIAPPARRYFKGRVADQPTATVFFSTSTISSDVSGLILIGEKTFVIGQGRRLPGQRGPKGHKEAPIFIEGIDPSQDGSAGPSFECATEKVTLPAGQLSLPAKPATLATVTNTAYELLIAIETDNEFHATFGAPGSATDAAVSTYIGELVGQTSVIYMRDLNTKLNIGRVNIRPSNVADDFVEDSNLYGVLYELGTYWHERYPEIPQDPPAVPPNPVVPRSATVMLTGRVRTGGIAWTDRICKSDRSCGLTCPTTASPTNWGGAYAVNAVANTGPETIVPNPNATTGDGIVYGLPATNHWMLQGFAHELGHVVGANHTHCTELTDAQKTAYGRNFVDECFSTTDPGCFSGPTSVPAEKGTLMSYCYLQTRAFGYPESRYLFGEAGKPSARMLAILSDELYYAMSTNNIIVGSNLPCQAGQTAIDDGGCAGLACTYSWAISGGSIQGSTTGASISFTPTAAAVTLTFSIANEKGCRITNSFAITSQCPAATLGPPANLVATAATSTSVNLSWTAVAGAASYAVERSANTVAYTVVGTPAGTLFTDSTPVADTSYLYRVAARDGAATTGAFSPADLATTVVFSGDPAVAASTIAQGLHVTELRTAVNATRVLAQLGTAIFTDSIAPSVPIRKTHVDELRSNLDASRAALGLVALSYTDPSITASSTTIKAAHFNELRNAVK